MLTTSPIHPVLDQGFVQAIKEARKPKNVRDTQSNELSQLFDLCGHEIIANNRYDITALLCGYDLPEFQYYILSESCDPVQQGKLEVFKNPRVMILAPRGFGKSTSGNVARCVHEVSINRQVKIFVISQSGSLAEGFLTETQGILEDPDSPIVRVHGDFFNTNNDWSKSEVVVTGRRKKSKEPTIRARGIWGAVISGHYNIVICDDILDKKTAESKLQRLRLKDIFLMSIIPCVKAGGQLVVIGTRYHIADMYGDNLSLSGQYYYYVGDGEFELRKVKTLEDDRSIDLSGGLDMSDVSQMFEDKDESTGSEYEDWDDEGGDDWSGLMRRFS